MRAPGVCWCCDRPFRDDEMVALGSHPEVTVCPGCARFLHRRARELEGHVLAGVVRRARDAVIEHGLHDRPVIGPILRRLDRFLP